MAAKKSGKKKAASAKKAPAKKTPAKKAPAKKAPAKKAAAKKAATKKAPAKKTPAKKAAASKPAAKKAAPKKATAGEATAAKDAGTEKKKAAAKFSANDVNMAHIFALRPRIATSFRPEDLRSAKHFLAEESFESTTAAARAVAEKALDLIHSGPSTTKKGNRSSRRW
jgi:hypothetical protein